MLPEIRQSDYLYPVPKFCLDRSDVKDFATELLGFHENFAECFNVASLVITFIGTWPANFLSWRENP